MSYSCWFPSFINNCSRILTFIFSRGKYFYLSYMRIPTWMHILYYCYLNKHCFNKLLCSYIIIIFIVLKIYWLRLTKFEAIPSYWFIKFIWLYFLQKLKTILYTYLYLLRSIWLISLKIKIHPYFWNFHFFKKLNIYKMRLCTITLPKSLNFIVS